MTEAEPRQKNEMSGAGLLRTEISDQAQSNRDKLRRAIAKAGAGFEGLTAAESVTAQAAHRHVARKAQGQVRSADVGAYQSL